MNVISRGIRSAAAGLLVALGACACGGGGGGYDDAGPPPATTGIGSAGGTVSGTNNASGASVAIPAGALAANTPIAVAQSSAGVPPLPAGLTAIGSMFAFTPHGTTFSVPVTITLPFNPATLPAGTTPQLYKTNAQNQWEQVANATFGANTVTAQITGFSDVTVVIPPLFIGDPVREWTFSDFRGRRMTKTELFSGRREGGTLEDIRDFGPQFPTSEFLDHDITSVGGIVIPADRRTNGQVFSTADGKTYGVLAEAPYATFDGEPAGSTVLLRQFQAFIKRSADATLTFTLTGAFIDLRDDNAGFTNNSTNPRCVYPPSQIGALDACQDLVRGQIILTVKAYTHAAGPTTPGRTFHHTAGIAEAVGHRGHFSAGTSPTMNSRSPLWENKDFQTDLLPGLTGLVMNFLGPRIYTVDLSSIQVGEEFTLNSVALAEATNRKGDKDLARREFPSAAAAFLRDPLGIGGTTLAFIGLEPTNNPVLVAPAEVPVTPAPCVPGPGPDPQAGVIEFSASSYSIDGFGGATQPVLITRSGGSRGAVTATFTTSNGTAIAGTDYTAVLTSVFFADGDAVARVAEVPITQSLVAGRPTRTVNLALSQPGSCAGLGAQAAAVLSIVADDDRPAPPPAFTIGGTVTGLVGSGLVLQDLTFLPITPGNGPFTFASPTNSGSPYAVTIVTQPTNPIQICTVSNGSGTVASANITNVAVNCVTPPASGALDASFGSGGKVSTAFGGDDTALALQADGRIVMAGGSGSDFVLARYNTDGSLDAGFGTGGLVTRDVGAGSADEARAVAIQADGKIVVAGNAVVGRTSNNQLNFDFALARFNADGSPDLSFGNGGKVTTDFNGQADRAFALAIQGDGKIVVAGSATPASGVSTDFALARYDSTGAPDNSFGNGGKLTADIGGAIDISQNIVVQPDGAILVSGVLTIGSSPVLGHAGLARFDANGNPDNSFGTAGKLTLPGLALGEALALQGDGKILIAGNAPVGGRSAFALMRLGGNGAADGGFGNAGLATVAFSAEDDFGRAVAVQADGRILVAGQSSNRINPEFALARFDTGGVLDGSFGAGGKLTIDFFGSFDGAENVAVQSDGRVVLGGFARNGTRTGYGLVRINP